MFKYTFNCHDTFGTEILQYNAQNILHHSILGNHLYENTAVGHTYITNDRAAKLWVYCRLFIYLL